MHNIFPGALFRQYAVVLAINLNCLSFGLGVNWPSPVMVKLANATETVLPRLLEREEASWIAAIAFLTGAIGYIMACGLMDLIGRKYCVILSSAAAIVSAVLFLFTSDVWMLMLGRAVTGLSQGLMLGVIPVYTSEIASKEVRGALGVMLQIFASFGSLIMLSVGPFMTYFRLNLMLTVFTFVTSIPTVFLPDSPVFLCARGRHEESRKVLTFLRGSELKANEELKEYLTDQIDEKLGLLTTFRRKTFLKSLGKSVFIAVFMYLIGFNCVVAYLQTILEESRTSIRSEVASGIIGGTQLVASFSTMLVTDRFGRKPILVSTLIGMTFGLVGLGTFFQLSAQGTAVSGFLNVLPLTSLIVIVFCYSAGLGSLFWIILAELFDDGSRGVGVPTTLLIGTVPAFLSVRYFSTFIASVGAAATFWTMAAFCVVLAAFISFRVPETNGKSSSEIQHALGNTEKS